MALTSTDSATRVLTIQQVAQRTGLSESTVRYYEHIGLITGVERDPGSGHRRYPAAVTQTLEALACLRSAGMRVADMRRYLLLREAGHAAAAEQRDLFRGHAERVAREIDRLQAQLSYLHWKAAMWDARDRGDARAEKYATEQAIQATDQFRESSRR